MECPKCQFENPEEARSCNECGNKLELARPDRLDNYAKESSGAT